VSRAHTPSPFFRWGVCAHVPPPPPCQPSASRTTTPAAAFAFLFVHLPPAYRHHLPSYAPTTHLPFRRESREGSVFSAGPHRAKRGARLADLIKFPETHTRTYHTPTDHFKYSLFEFKKENTAFFSVRIRTGRGTEQLPSILISFLYTRH